MVQNCLIHVYVNMLLECEQNTTITWFLVHTETFAVAYCWPEFNTKKKTLVEIYDPNETMHKAEYHDLLSKN